ncbi:MAG: alpha-E domain-containing protein [Planctomycetota bacterium]|nr:MAG: alpha-E domain-containing protein [Planctomycetota bacterium]REJ92954.1 MAG: alpha-E domain-containing protein [Planctomycetota bacterium]REK30928.1 MAG: alpha-E domain-containing protein [Planctomycetota bacterium]
MLSRVASSIYWMSRYVERAENVARFVSVNLNLSLDFPREGQQQWLPLVVTTGDNEAFNELYDEPSRHNVIRFLTFDRDNPNSILSCLTAARENARSVRECISAEMWEHINNFYLMVKEGGGYRGAIDQIYDFFERIRSAGQQFAGITDATMTHGEAWHFSRFGRSIERADKTSRILDVKYFILLPSPDTIGTPLDVIQWSALLRSASALEMYRQRHGRISPTRVVEFLILDNEFPRAVLHCLTKANESLHAITGAKLGGFSNQPEQTLGQLRAELAYTSAEEVIDRGLHEFVDDLQMRLNLVGEAVYDAFFAMRPMKPPSFAEV